MGIEATRVLRVLTLNIWSRNHWSERRDDIVAWIEHLQPDVVGLQEVDRAAEDCQATWLGEQTGLATAFGGNDRPGGRLFGNAVLSRFPLLGTERRDLTTAGLPGEGRLCLRATLDAPWGPTHVYTTHLNYLFDHGFVRERQVQEIAAFIGESGHEAFPPVLVGDLNAVPGSTEVRYLKGQTSLGGGSFHLFDAFEVSQPSAEGYTWDNRNPYAAQNRVPNQRIDYVFVGVRTPDGAGQVLHSEVVFDRPMRQSWPSDHFGLLADLSCPPPPEQ